MSQHEINSKLVYHDFKVTNDEQGLNVYCIFDKKLNKFLPPFFSSNDDDAKRQFSGLVNFSGNVICRFPEDYSLFYVSKFIESIAFFSPAEPRKICEAVDVKTEESKNYDNILNQIEHSKSQVQDLIESYRKLVATVPLNKSTDNTSQKGPQLYEAKGPVISNQKKSILKKLFSH